MSDTVELMRNRVLDMALRGKLVEQRLEEGILVNTLDNFDITLTSQKIEEDSMPFDIPPTWLWVKLGDIGQTNIGLTYKPSDKSEDGIIVLRSSNIQNGKMDYSDLVRVNMAVPKNKMISKGDLLICARNGSKRLVGKTATVDEDGHSFGAFMTSFKSPFNPYIFQVLNSCFFRSLLDGTSTTTINQITQNMLKNFMVPLPPLSEQKRIVAKIEEIFAVIDQIGTKKEEALSIIRKMRQTALQDAIMGVLVDQEDEDEPASILYEKIQAEKEKLVKEKKIKKEKPFPEIEAEEILFEIPDSWKWTRLGEISILLNGDRGKNYPGKRYWVDEGIPFINAGTLNNRYLSKDNMNFIPEERYELLSNGFVEKNDIIYCLRGSLGKISINKDFDKGAIASSVVIIRSIGDTNVEYLYYLLTSDYGKDLIKKVDSGTAQPNLSAKNVSEYIIPLPPLAEQHRIVEKLDEIMAIYDQMEAIFDGSSETNKALKIAE